MGAIHYCDISTANDIGNKYAFTQMLMVYRVVVITPGRNLQLTANT